MEENLIRKSVLEEGGVPGTSREGKPPAGQRRGRHLTEASALRPDLGLGGG